MAESFWWPVAPPLLGGAVLSLLIEQRLEPRPALPWKRPLSAAAIHAGLWLFLFAGVLAVFRRPFFAAGIVLACMLLVVLVSNAKRHSLREPFVFQDFEYFADALRHPRLYLPFLGVSRALTAVLAFVLAWYAGIVVERSLTTRTSMEEFLTGTIILAAAGAGLLWLGARGKTRVAFEPDTDLRNLGLTACLWRYAAEESNEPFIASIYDCATPDRLSSGERPHLVVVQSESFFDARRLFAGIRPEVLTHYDALRASSVCNGRLEVSAWGANTVRTEFAFLSGLAPQALGVHRFNPYRKLARKNVPTLASYLKCLGYRTICVHPYPASFYARDSVYPLLGFDEFIDIRGFDGAESAGPYVGDRAVAEKVCALLEAAAEGPIFVFVITMENHGPLHLEKALPDDAQRFYSSPPPGAWDALTVYLRHLRNADRMAGMLRERLQELPGTGWLCWFGDHVPILPAVYEETGFADGRTDYVVWGKEQTIRGNAARDLRVEELGGVLLEEVGLLPKA